MFMNLSRDLLGLGPSDGTMYQESSYGKRERVLPGTVGRFMKKCVDLSPGATFTAADIEGPGLVTRLWVTVPRIDRGVLRKLVLKIYWDGEEEPSVLVPLGDLFGTTFGRPRDYVSAYLSITSGAYVSFFPMPFGSRMVMTVENQSMFPVPSFFYQLTYLRLNRDLPAGTPYFHCLWHRENLQADGAPYTILDAGGRGFYMGCHLDMQGVEYPWSLNPVRNVLPHGMGLGILEGWERMWIDGSVQPNVHGTGGEDYFNGAWYFTHVPSTSPTHGVTKRSYATRRVSCYRFHAEMPVAFDESIRVTLDHGLENMLPAIYEGTSYWYQEEPHAPFGELPAPGERRPAGAARNLIMMSSPIALGAAGLLAARRAMRVRGR